ncbi:MAG: hypothetical protein L3I99_05795 [Sulfurimonas sp.]|nr:hypothetical protein [Sulfurimonas sp.]
MELSIKLKPATKKVLTAIVKKGGANGGYKALDSALSSKNKADLRACCNHSNFITDNALIWCIINECSADTGLDLKM